MTATPVPGTALDIDPEHLFFDDVAIGATRTRHLRVHNHGRTPVQVLGVSIAPSGSPFAVASDSCSGATLQHHDRCEIDVSYTATHAGFDRATLTVNADSGPQYVPLRGEGRSDDDGRRRHNR